MLNLKTSTKCLLVSTAVAGTMFANSFIKIDNMQKEVQEQRSEEAGYNPFRSPLTMGTIFSLGLLGTVTSARNKNDRA